MVETDHKALSFLISARTLTDNLVWWALLLQEFDFTIKYRPGSKNLMRFVVSPDSRRHYMCGSFTFLSLCTPNVNTYKHKHYIYVYFMCYIFCVHDVFTVIYSINSFVSIRLIQVIFTLTHSKPELSHFQSSFPMYEV